MYSSILIPVALDHETLVGRKLDVARSMLAEGGKITLLTVLENIPAFVAEFVTVRAENHLSEQVLAKLKAVAGDAPDIECAVATGKPGVQIVEHASEAGCDLIIIAAHHPNAMDYFLGSTASRVARRADANVLILR
jgi:nucleotide-binding universal stress UspA family protein